jgi:hypothetical protein
VHSRYIAGTASVMIYWSAPVLMVSGRLPCYRTVLFRLTLLNINAENKNQLL